MKVWSIKVLLTMLKPAGFLLSFIRFKYGRLRLISMMNQGLRVGKNVYIENGCSFDPVYPYLIEIGDNCRIANGVTILAHDATIFRELGVNRVAPVKILEGCFIGEGAIILPGVTIGPNAMIAAGSMVNRDIGDGKVAAGNPARPYANFNDMLDKYRNILSTSKVFSKEAMENGQVTPADIINQLKKDPVAFIQGIPQSDPCYINADMENIRNSATQAFDELNQSYKKCND